MGTRLARRIGPEIVAAALAAGAAVAVSWRALGTGFPLDDAWIHMVYGLSLATHGSLAYDDGHASTGCTSPAWAVLVALAHLVVGARGPSMLALAAVQCIGVALHAAQASLAARLVRAWAPARRWGAPLAMCAGALVACAPTLAFAAPSGMEVALTGTLLLAALLAATRRRWTLAGGLAGMAAVARPEATLVVVALPVIAALVASARDALRAAGAGVLPVAVLAARNLFVSGRPLPATYYVKANPGAQPLAASLERGVVMVLGGMPPASHGVFWACVAAAVGVGATVVARGVATRRRRGPAVRTTAMVGTTALLGVAWATGISALTFFEKPTAFYYQRYLAPPLVLMVVAGLAGAAWLAHATGRRTSTSTRWKALAATMALAVAGVADEVGAWGAHRARFADDVASTNAQQVAIGRWIDAHLRPGAVVWTIDAGAVRYWGRRPTVDLVRLNTPELFDGSRVHKAWWPTAIVLIPEVFQTVTFTALLDVALVAESPSAAPGAREAWRHEVHVCRPDVATAKDNRVLVFFHQQQTLLAVGRCVAP
jgi:hypothetical protein